jgi:molybdate transport system substrate-binding protein
MNFSPEPLPVFAAGSLREAMTDVARDYETRTGQKIALPFSIRNAWPMRVLGARPQC